MEILWQKIKNLSGRRIVTVITAVLMLIVAGFAFGYIYLNSDQGKQKLVSWINDNLRHEDSSIKIDSIEGSIFSHFTVATITFSDLKDTWLELHEVNIKWSPLMLVYNKISLSDINIQNARFIRRPNFTKQNSSSQNPLISLPSLPMDIDIKSFAVEQIDISKSIVGKSAKFYSNGALKLTETNGILAQIYLTNKGKGKDEITVDIAYPEAEQDFTADIKIKAPKGGIFALLSGINSEQDVQAALQGTGPINNWSGNFEAHIGDTKIADATLRRTGKSLSIEAKLDAGNFVEDTNIALLGRTATLSFDVKPSENVDQSDISLELIAQTIQLKAKGILTPSNIGSSDKIDFSLNVTDTKPFNRLISPSYIEPFTLNGRLNDLTRDPKIIVKTEKITLGYEKKISARIRGEIMALFHSGNIHFSGNGFFNDIKGDEIATINPLVAPGLSWGIKGNMDQGNAYLNLDNLFLSNSLISLLGQGKYQPKTGILSAQLKSNLFEIKNIMPEVSGRLAIKSDITQANEEAPLKADFTATTQNISLKDGFLDNIFGHAPTLKGTLYSAKDGTLDVKNINFDAKHITFTAKAKLSPEQNIHDADFQISLFDLNTVENLKGLALEGRIDAEGVVTGPLQSPSVVLETALKHLNIQNVELDNFQARINAESIILAAKSVINIEADSNYGPLKAQINFSLDQEDKHHNIYNIPSLHIVLGSYQANGYLKAKADNAVNGLITIQTLNVPKTQNPVQGNIDAKITFLDQAGKQKIAVDADLMDINLSLDRTYLTTLKKGKISGDLLFTGAFPQITLKADFFDLMHPKLQAQNIKLALDQAENSLAYNLHIQGTKYMPYDLSFGGKISSLKDNIKQITLGLDGTIDSTRISLEQPVTLMILQDGISVPSFKLNLGKGYIMGGLNKIKNNIETNLTAAMADLGPLDIFLPEIPLTGFLTGELNIIASTENVDGSFSFVLSDINFMNQAMKDEQKLRISIKGKIKEKNTRFSGKIHLNDQLNGQFSGLLPLEINVSQTRIALARDKALSGEIIWTGELGPIWPLADLVNHDLTGNIDSKLNLSGSLNNPDLDGYFELTDGRYENAQTGFVASNIDMRASILDRNLTLDHFRANDGEKGTLSAKAAINIHPNFTYDAKGELTTTHAHIIRQPQIDVTASSLLMYQKNDAITELKGYITVENANIGAITQGGSEIIDLKVREINMKGEESTLPEDTGAHLGPVSLNLSLKAPKKLFIRSYGLDSEWDADLTITGMSSAPIITGTASLIRGSFEFSGKRFDLSRGELTLPNDKSNDPLLDITAEHKMIDLMAILQISGRASAPILKISSIPSLPQDEVLSRILFGTSLAELSAIEAVQLAAAIRSLSKGGGSGFMGGIRNALGIDRLSIDKAADHKFGTTITGGRYLTNNIYVEVTTSPTTGETATSIEVGITHGLSLITRRTLARDNSLALRWSWKY
ncbi:MAG: translocation/assembly module TamB domain-containing protein [Emcibacter sp.]|nr:translocation/assembly module TamB domain-containing protein [Emcibacter sp.]